MVSRGRKIISRFSAICLLYSIFFFHIYLLCSSPVYCYARDILKQDELIIDNGTTLVSSGGHFVLGFFTPMGSFSRKRFVGIWYRWDPQAVVWVANRKQPIFDGSTGAIRIAEDGNLKVFVPQDPTGKDYWSTGLEKSSSRSRTVKLMDSGNLVLSGDDQLKGNLWESFKYPTDTFLPGMKMDEKLTLTSWTGVGDPVMGNYTFIQSPEGEGYYVIQSQKTHVDYWKSGNTRGLSSSDEIFDLTITDLLSNFSRSVKSSSSKDSQISGRINSSKLFNSTQILVPNNSSRRLVMNYTGKLQYYRWDGAQNWILIWSEPKDECGIYKFCGKFSSCNINNKLRCKCLPGFKPDNPKIWDSGDFSGGCARNSNPSPCAENETTFLGLKMMKVISFPSLFLTEPNETQCRMVCLNSCECRAYSYQAAENSTRRDDTTTSNNCRIWNEDLTDLQEEYTEGRNLSVRAKKSDIEPTGRECEPCGTNMIPYPLSTRPNCGDPMYFSFNCDTSTGQVNFSATSGVYRVESIDPSKQKFVIRVKYAKNGDASNSGGTLRLNNSLPFYETPSLTSDEAEISWNPPPEPTCTSSSDCMAWPHSTCTASRDGERRCHCKPNFRWDAPNLNCTEVPGQNKPNLILLGTIGTIILILCITCSVYYLKRRRVVNRNDNKRSSQGNVALHLYDTERRVKDLIDSVEFREDDKKGIDVPFFDLASILAATDNFSDANKLGQGGFGPVYKGKFPGGEQIAIKRLSRGSGQGLEEFKNEVVLIAKLQHRNLVRLLGYCIDGDEKMLLYEYMPNKSLDSFLFDRALCVLLNWEIRFNIILGIARGLLYLHQDSRLRIIHRDLKTSNVLLDDEMNPKISDFGLARIVGGKQTEGSTTRVFGTYGYMSPEYALDGFFSVKSDVFSFGVVLLEIISGKRNTGFYQPVQTLSLLGYAWKSWKEDKVLDLIDQPLRGNYNTDEFLRCVIVGLLCVQEDPADRPTMSNAVFMLGSENASLPTPKQPAYVVRRSLSSTASSSSKPERFNEITASLEGR